MMVVQIVAGLDEGIASMKVGGLRRLYIPGNLSFPKGLPSGPGRSVALLAYAYVHCQYKASAESHRAEAAYLCLMPMSGLS